MQGEEPPAYGAQRQGAGSSLRQADQHHHHAASALHQPVSPTSQLPLGHDSGMDVYQASFQPMDARHSLGEPMHYQYFQHQSPPSGSAFSHRPMVPDQASYSSQSSGASVPATVTGGGAGMRDEPETYGSSSSGLKRKKNAAAEDLGDVKPDTFAKRRSISLVGDSGSGTSWDAARKSSIASVASSSGGSFAFSDPRGSFSTSASHHLVPSNSYPPPPSADPAYSFRYGTGSHDPQQHYGPHHQPLKQYQPQQPQSQHHQQSPYAYAPYAGAVPASSSFESQPNPSSSHEGSGDMQRSAGVSSSLSMTGPSRTTSTSPPERPGSQRDVKDEDSSGPLPAGDLRMNHKLAERKRRKEMAQLFDDLRDVLPVDRSTKSSKWETLTKAVDFIIQLKQYNYQILSENQALRQHLAAVAPHAPYHADGAAVATTGASAQPTTPQAPVAMPGVYPQAAYTTQQHSPQYPSTAQAQAPFDEPAVEMAPGHGAVPHLMPEAWPPQGSAQPSVQAHGLVTPFENVRAARR